jgi:hypothetical protein
MTAKKEKTIGETRRVSLKIPKYRMYDDYGNHWCVHVALTMAEAEGWKKQLQNAFSVHIEKITKKVLPGGYAYAVYVHG